MWAYNPHVGGKNIPRHVRAITTQRIQQYAAKHHSGKFTKLDFRFHGPLCYIDAYTEPDAADPYFPSGETREQYLKRLRSTPTHLCRLRYFGNDNHWSFSFYTYSQDKYEPSVFLGGQDFGTPELALETCVPFLSS
jgi:hypothetical protein